MKNLFDINTEINIEKIEIVELKDLKENMKVLSDPRVKCLITYKIWDIVTVAFLAVLAEANDWDEIYEFAVEKYKWLKSFLQLTGGIPSAQTYKNVISMLNPDEITKICNDFIFKIINNSHKQDIISIDGKVDKSSSRIDHSILPTITGKPTYKSKPLNVLNAYSHNLGICLYSLPIEDKTNEIPMTKEILNRFNVKGNIITVDALNTQKDNALTVIKKKGDYVFALKNNHGDLYEKLITYFNDNTFLDDMKKRCYLKEVSKENSNVITREYYQTNNINWLEEKDDWKKLKTIGCIVKTIYKQDGSSIFEKRYYISSLDEDINLFSKAIRSHWGVENKLHWQLDFTFKCDDNTTENKSALLNLQVLKKFALNILNIVKPHYNCSLKKIRYKIALNTEVHLETIFNILAKEKSVN